MVVASDGSSRTLPLDDFEVMPTGTWDSAIDGSTYPSGWTVRIPAEGIDLTVTPVIEDQELEYEAEIVTNEYACLDNA